MQKFYPDRIIKKLANLQLAIGLLLVIGIVVALGTFIEQEQSIAFYKQNYPFNKPILGFLNWELLLFLNLDRVYTSWWFILILIVFGLSLLSCTLSIQLPALKRFRRWKFYTNVKRAQGIEQTLPRNTTNSLTYQLHSSNYHIFRQGKKNYAYSGLLGRAGPIVVHASIILLLLGSTVGSFSGYMAQEIVPRGEVFHAQNLIKFGSLSNIPQEISWRVNDFWITYTETLKTNQFYSDLSLLDNFGNEIKRKTIFVNEPFVYKGITLYQTDWDIVGLKIRQKNGLVSQIPMKKINKNGRKFWFGSLNFPETGSKPISVLLNDLQGSIYLYDEKGALITKSTLGAQIFLTEKNISLTFVDFLTSTGLQIKADPGLRTVYLAFLFLIISVYASFITYSQIWATESLQNLSLAGNSNRAVLFFQTEFRKILNQTSKNL
jgi:cytochrome c biogenesis protein